MIYDAENAHTAPTPAPRSFKTVLGNIAYVTFMALLILFGTAGMNGLPFDLPGFPADTHPAYANVTPTPVPSGFLTKH